MELPVTSWEEEVGARAAGRLVVRALERLEGNSWDAGDVDVAVRVSARRLTGRQRRILAAALAQSGEPLLEAAASRAITTA